MRAGDVRDTKRNQNYAEAAEQFESLRRRWAPRGWLRTLGRFSGLTRLCQLFFAAQIGAHDEFQATFGQGCTLALLAARSKRITLIAVACAFTGLSSRRGDSLERVNRPFAETLSRSR